MRYQGKVTHWKDDQGFGFITQNGSGKRVFVHIKSFLNRQRRPVENEIVTYELNADNKGRPQAISVAFVGERLPSAASYKRSNISFIFTTAFLAFVAWSTFVDRLPLAILGFYFAASAITFITYALDKSAARNERWRTQENTLHFFALVGGWPGALVAQKLFRHKSKKRSFQIVFWATVILNCSAFFWLFSPSGAEILRSVLA